MIIFSKINIACLLLLLLAGVYCIFDFCFLFRFIPKYLFCIFKLFERLNTCSKVLFQKLKKLFPLFFF
uniref:Uncharacterized protein n=1 Tax=Panagrolaimus sp. ES5 TaxID=591445 RepID=A0AC34FNG8_9BILA